MGLKVFFLEIVHPDLDSGKVWEFSIFSFCTPPGEISGLPLLNLTQEELTITKQLIEKMNAMDHIHRT